MFIAHVVGNIFSVNFAIFPVCIVLTRLAYLIRQHQKQIEHQEQKYVDEFESPKRLSDSEDCEAQTPKKKGECPPCLCGGPRGGSFGILLVKEVTPECPVCAVDLGGVRSASFS